MQKLISSAPVRYLILLWRKFGAAAIPVCLAICTFIVGLISWSFFAYSDKFICLHPHEYPGAIHRIWFVFLRTNGSFFPSVWNINEGNFGTDLAAVLGLATVYSSFAIIAANRFAGTLLGFAARFIYRDHVLVIGGTPLARRAADRWARRRRVVHLIGPADPLPKAGRRCIASPLDCTIIQRFGLPRAAALFIDLGEDMATLALALELLPGAPCIGQDAGDVEEKAAADWTLVVNDKTLPDQFARQLESRLAQGQPVPHVHYFSPQRTVVRDMLAEHPLFLDDRSARSGGIHALIVGFGSAGSHLVEAIFLTSLVAGRPLPRVTILSPTAKADCASFLAGRSSIVDELDIAFVDMAALDDLEGATGSAAQLLRERDGAAPITTIFLMSDTFNENVRLAMRVKRVGRKTGRLATRLLALESIDQPEAACRVSRTFAQTIGNFSAFGLSDGRLDAQICDPARRDLLARALHDSYMRSAGQVHPTWSELDESRRRANSNAADHALAKLHMLGFDVAGLPAATIPRLAQTDARDILNDLRAATDGSTGPLADLIQLEHLRWSIERRLDGWTFGEPRNNERQVHPLLLDWDDLCARYPDEQAKDKQQVEALIECLASFGDPRRSLTRFRRLPQ